MINLNFPKQNKNGFTLPEMLYSIGILFIVLAIAIPSVNSLRKNLQINELDDTARQIYIVAQNELTSMKASGSLEQFKAELEENYSDHSLGTLDIRPQDYENADDEWKNFYIINKDDKDQINTLLSNDSVLISSLDSESNFIIELNPETGDIYGVFYAKKDFNYNDVSQKGLVSRNKSDRKKVMIGYYGGPNELSASSEYPKKFTPSVEVVNQEDLFIKVTCPDMKKLIKTQQHINVTITITDEDYAPDNTKDHIWHYNLNPIDDFWLNNDTLSFEYLLDSIRGGDETFAEITDGKINSGDNIRITVNIVYNYDGVTISGSDTINTNSLFGSKDENGTINIYTLRHLNNLRNNIISFDESKNVTIVQTADIDFNSNSWSETSLIDGADIENPLAKSGFTPIDNYKLLNKATYNGNNNKLLNFYISGSNNVGIFAKLDHSNIINTKIVNCSVKGKNNIASLVGSMNGGTIKNSGIYIEVKDKNSKYLLDIDESVKKHSIVSNGENVGGLIGKATGYITISDSFSAINTTGVSNVGGLIGNMESGTISRCYSSGEISASSYTGGLVGYSFSPSIYDCYSSSNISTDSYGGGIVGYTQNGYIVDSIIYGKVSKNDDSVDLLTSGIIFGKSTTNVTNCKYLSQTNFNSDYSVPTGAISLSYSELISYKNNSNYNSHPYSNNLLGSSFPFILLRDENNDIIDHYGNWPEEPKLAVSLVYYEKYSTPDKTGSYYGYYTNAALASTPSDKYNEQPIYLKLDTLRDMTCVEDGYALMSEYSITDFSYHLNDNPENKTLIVSNLSSSQTAVDISDGKTLNFSDISTGSIFETSNIKIYQLPFELQNSNRLSDLKFYDKLKISGNISSAEKFKDVVFYYCPDFAKSSILETSNSSPNEPNGIENPIYIRSARQLNTLGRSSYYWGSKNTEEKLYFLQESDIDFGKYTSIYCGKIIDFMNTDSYNTYRNMPIGRQTSEVFTDLYSNKYSYNNFSNNYNGNSKKIIDYRCYTTSSDNCQFTGLFGKIHKAKLENIIMVASNPETISGYIKSSYSNSGNHVGIGTLVGNIYVESGDEYSGQYSTVSNCAVSGYTVSYTAETALNPVSIGGISGYNFGRIENASSVCKLINVDSIHGNFTMYIGGISGSINGRGSISNAYSGGTLTSATQSDKSSYLGGICGGFDDIYGAYNSYDNKQKRSQKIINCYSYYSWSIATELEDIYAISNQSDMISIINCSYLTDIIGTDVILKDAGYTNAKSYSELSITSFNSNGSSFKSGIVEEGNSHPWSNALSHLDYPFPGIVKDCNTGKYIHYGDWHKNQY